jgi:hypothetical protein
MTSRVGWGIAGLSLATLGLLWGTTWPLGIPGEWVWVRHPADAQTPWDLLVAIVWGGIYLGFLIAGEGRLARGQTSRVEIEAWLLGLVVFAFGWSWAVQETAPSAGQLAKGPFVLFYPSSSGYFSKVRWEQPDVGPFLAAYEALMAEGDVLHVGTHPPGLFLVFHGLFALQRAWPTGVGWIAETQPESYREALRVVRENTALSPFPASETDGEILWLATLLVMALSAATVWPLYRLLRWTWSPSWAWWFAGLWPLVPAAIIFIPKSDAAYPGLATLFVWAAIGSWRQRSVVGAFAAGLLAWLGLMASLAFLPVYLFVVSYLLGSLIHPVRRAPGRAEVLWLGSAVLGFALPIVTLAVGGGLNLLSVWVWNYRNHAGFYAEYSRTWWKWLLVNPLELLFAVGAPLLLLAIIGGWSLWRNVAAQPNPLDPAGARSLPPGVIRAACCGLAIGVILWLSGKNSGEAARLWILFFPGVLWLATFGFRTADRAATPPWRVMVMLVTIQTIVAILTIHRVGGFHFETPA